VPLVFLVRLLLPDRIRPHAPVWCRILSSREVIAHAMRSTPQSGPGEWSELLRVKAEGHAAVVQVGMSRPLSSWWAVRYAVCRPGTEGDEDVRALVLQDVLHSAPCRSALAVLGPDECFRRLHVSKFSAILVPSSGHTGLTASIFSRPMLPAIFSPKGNRKSREGHGELSRREE
jgi:hypothetical protein